MDGANRKPTCDFLSVNISIYICSILNSIVIQNINDLEFDLSRSLKVTVDFLLVNNSKYMHICCISCDTAIGNMHNLEFDLSRSLKVKVNGAIGRRPQMTSY